MSTEFQNQITKLKSWTIGVMIKKVKIREIAHDVVIQIASHIRLALRKMQNATIVKNLATLQKFASLQTKAALQKPKKAGKKEIGSRTHPQTKLKKFHTLRLDVIL